MTLAEIRASAIAPALELLPAQMTSPEAVVMLLAIGLQESRFQHRRQLVGSPPRPVGPAKSFWQAEQGGGMVRGLLRYHDPRVRDLATGLCVIRGVALRSEEHTSELQSRPHLVCRLLLEKKKNNHRH